MLQYLEITKLFPDTCRELAAVYRNATLRPGALPLYVVITKTAFEVLYKVEIAKMQECVAEAAKSAIHEICGSGEDDKV